MPAPHRRGLVPRRRRRDEGEDESSTAGDLDDFSTSEGSAITNGEDEADIEGSELSVEDEDARGSVAGIKISGSITDHQTAPGVDSNGTPAVTNTPLAKARTASNGLQDEDSVSIDGVEQDRVGKASSSVTDRATSSAPQLSQPSETQAERSKREHLEYIKQRNSNPAFVPNRGGFFLHDDRSAAPASPFGRPFPRGRGRGYNPGYGIGRGFVQPASGPTDRQWAHDLHDTVNKTFGTTPTKDVPASFQIPTAKPAAIAPNRTFSVSTVLGNVTVQVYMPGMESKKIFQNLVKKQHTLLPQHRPPLRRDKPVRISIPDEEPRYIFPSTERSFIFIPRAMRPNQQVYARGRGRGSYQGSRRASIMGSTYTPSVAMSRKSSLGGTASNGIRTPTDVTIPRGPMMQNFNRPIVRMPVAPLSATNMPPLSYPTIPALGPAMPAEYSNQGPTILHSPTVALPMHQPRPQKAVSVAEIELPAVKAPQQQQEQPFHQQIPSSVNFADGRAAQQAQPQPHLTMTAPLSHIPEGAVYAQPFQPYPMYPQGVYYGSAYTGGPMIYQTPNDPYGMNMGGPVLPTQFAAGQNFVPITQSNDGGMQPGAMAHESNGMVYYYDPSQFPGDGSQMTQYPVATGGGMVGVPGTGPYFYPAMPGGMFYPTAQ